MLINLAYFAIILFVIGLVITYVVFRSIMQTVLIGLLLLFIAFITVGSLIYGDIALLQNNFLKQPKLVLFENNQQFLVGLNITSPAYNCLKEPLTVLGEVELDMSEVFYEQNDLRGLQNGYYKIIIIKLAPFYDISQDGISFKGYLPDTNIDNPTLEFALNRPMTKHYAYNVLKSDNPLNIFVERNSNLSLEEKESLARELTAIFNNSHVFKATLALIMAQKVFESGGYYLVVEQYKKGNIMMYPETFALKFAKHMPSYITARYIERNKDSFLRE